MVENYDPTDLSYLFSIHGCKVTVVLVWKWHGWQIIWLRFKKFLGLLVTTHLTVHTSAHQ